jgi:hypothetical protein
MNNVVEMEPVARAWLARTDTYKRRLSEVLIWAQESETERCYEIASVLQEVLHNMQADRNAAAAALELLTGGRASCLSRRG